ncbi:thermonuclease family protein [Halopseudomonas aestusnigri]|uniref:Nuclease homologue n=1 Tax=Halopseudomonas aestusnigri TaxID=857252 RepID=A0AAQ1G843_9GAMM|nr:thermonuclease family protein [Halopseudomonas aestusnigri]OWL88136.1 hypothetical protein B7O88_11735 [Halopseudomonas aestusnigri]SEG47274.1 nuclease homologue [Halopseudomonas aestusnigri]
MQALVALANEKKASLVGAFFLVCSLLAGCVQADPPQASCVMPPGVEAVSVRSVTDGDTLRLADGRRLRLAGINTPEIGRDGKASEPWAQAARRELLALVDSESLQLKVGDDPQDHYGRTLGYLFDSHGRSVEAQLLQAGLGYAIVIPPNAALADCYLAAERDARQARRGLWQADVVRSVEELAEGGFHLLRGRVAAVTQESQAIWIDLEGPLTLRLERRDLVNFASVPGASWVGREIEVRGWVADRREQQNGFRRYMISLRHPAQLHPLSSD